MVKSQRITNADVRKLFVLLGECRELGDDALLWRTHFLAGVSAMVDADAAGGAEAFGCLANKLRFPAAAVWGFDHGFDLEGLRIIWSWNETPHVSRLWTKLQERICEFPGGVTASRPQMLSDREWDRSVDYQVALRTMGANAVVHSFHQLPCGGDAFDGLFWTRLEGRPQFNERETTLITLVHQETTRLVGGPLARIDEPRPTTLPPRMRQVLQCLLEGDGDKQVALRLNISTHTVNQYTKQIYRHFGVTSRPELLARWIRRGWTSKAAWNEPIDGYGVMTPVSQGQRNI